MHLSQMLPLLWRLKMLRTKCKNKAEHDGNPYCWNEKKKSDHEKEEKIP